MIALFSYISKSNFKVGGSAKRHGTTSCYRDYLLLSKIPLLIGTTSCHQKHLLLSTLPLVIGNTLVIEATSCYRKHLLLLRLPLVIKNTACYRDYLLISETPLTIERHFCQTPSVIPYWLLICPSDRSFTVPQHFTSLSEFLNEQRYFKIIFRARLDSE